MDSEIITFMFYHFILLQSERRHDRDTIYLKTSNKKNIFVTKIILSICKCFDERYNQKKKKKGERKERTYARERIR